MTEVKQWRAHVHVQDENGKAFDHYVLGNFNSPMEASVAATKFSLKRSNVIGITVAEVKGDKIKEAGSE